MDLSVSILTFLSGGDGSRVKLAARGGRKRMLAEEIPERLGYVEISVGHGPAMFAVADGIQNHISAAVTVAPLLPADRVFVKDVRRLGVATVASRPGRGPLWDRGPDCKISPG